MSPSDGGFEFPDHQEMELAIPANPVTTNPQPANHESSNTGIKEEEEEEEGDEGKLLPTDSSIPSFPHSLRSEEPTLSGSTPSSPRPPQPRQVQIHIPESPTQPIDNDKADPTHPVFEIAEKQELGKAIIVLAVPMVMGLLTTYDSFAKTIEMKVVAVTLCLAFASIWNGILLRKTYRTASILILMAGIALMMLALYTYLGCILPIYFKWIPVACWFLSIFPLVPVFVALICRRKKKADKVASKERDLEKAEV